MQRVLAVFSAVLLASGPALADRLTLANGDRLTGEVLRLIAGELTFRSDLAGEVRVRWDSVAGVESDAPLYVGFEDGQLLSGRLALDADEAAIENEEAGTVRLPRDAILTIRSETERQAFVAAAERRANPALTDLWTAALDAALSLTSGNAESRTMNVGMQAARRTAQDRISLYFTSLFARNATTGITITTANAIRGGSRYEIDLNERLYTFGFTDLEFDRFQDLDLRFVLGGGLGARLIETPRSAFEVFAGGSSNQEFFGAGLRRKSGESLLGQEWTWNLNDTVSFTERLAVYPNLTDPGEYRVTFDSTTTTAINDWLGWQVTLSDRFLSNPTPGKRNNDLLFTTGIQITIGRGNLADVGPSALP